MPGDAQGPADSEQTDHRQWRLDPDLHGRQPVHPDQAGRDSIGITISQFGPDQFPGPCRPGLRVPVGPGPESSALGSAVRQHVTHVQGQAELQDGDEEQRQQPTDQGEVNDRGASVTARRPPGPSRR